MRKFFLILIPPSLCDRFTWLTIHVSTIRSRSPTVRICDKYFFPGGPKVLRPITQDTIVATCYFIYNFNGWNITNRVKDYYCGASSGCSDRFAMGLGMAGVSKLSRFHNYKRFWNVKHWSSGPHKAFGCYSVLDAFISSDAAATAFFSTVFLANISQWPMFATSSKMVDFYC